MTGFKGLYEYLEVYMLVAVEEFRDKFIGEKKPDIVTIRNWIRRGDLPGKKIGGLFYVLIEDGDHSNTVVEELQQPDFSRYGKKTQ